MDRLETINLTALTAPAEALRTVQVECDVVKLAGVTVRVVQVAHLRHSFEVRLELDGDVERRDALTMRWTERNWHWGVIDDVGNRYSERGGSGGMRHYAVRFEPALAPDASILGVRLVEAGRVLGGVLIRISEAPV